MSVHDFRKYVEKEHPSTCVPIDLLQIGKSLEAKDECRPVSHIVIDAEWTLNRLYGGYLADYVCGGQWSRMINFLGHFTRNLSKNKIEITVFLDGTTGSTKDWIANQMAMEEKMMMVTDHLHSKWTCPPRELWVPPDSLHMNLRLAFRHLGIKMVISVDDHRLELMKYVVKHHCTGVLSDDPELFAFNPPRLFSSTDMIMIQNRKINTTEFHMDEIAKALRLERSRIPIVSSLLGNHIVSAEDLSSFHRQLQGDSIKKESNFVVVRAVVDFVRELESVDDLGLVSHLVFGSDNVEMKEKFQKSVAYYKIWPLSTADVVSDSSESQRGELPRRSSSTAILEPFYHQMLSERDPKLMSHTSSCPLEVGSSKCDPDKCMNRQPVIDSRLLREVRQRHQCGAIDPAIYRLLVNGVYLVPITFGDVTETELPCLGLFYQPIRQMVFSLLFDNIHPAAIVIYEWMYKNGNKFVRAEPVLSRSLGWSVPSMDNLWFGTSVDDCRNRFRTFLSCMRSNTPLMWDTGYVPTRVLILCCVLRFIISDPVSLVIHKPELDAFLVQATDRRRPSENVGKRRKVRNIQLPYVKVRAAFLASLFMRGVEMALLVNDVCGTPVPQEACLPHHYFDGMYFQKTLFKAEACRNLIGLCDGNMQEVHKIENMRAAIIEDILQPYRLSSIRPEVP